MKHFLWVLVCLGLFVGCQPASNTGGGDSAPAGDGGNATTAGDEMGAIELNEPTMNTSVTKFAVKGMVCEEGCVATVKAKLQQLPGVQSVDVDFEAGTATVVASDGFDRDAALQSITSID
ncbi:MAG: heavy-metal-associated domain-containing protein, partial [Planctomycetales bacterium]|nr:heavy-metal-associated domain-containing protein [Planctomycetales bacterium]